MQTDIGNLTSSNMTGTRTAYVVETQQTEGVSESGETRIGNENFTKWYGYYKTIPEYKSVIDTLAIWTVGKGFTVDSATQVLLDSITGSGSETFHDVIWNAQVVKKFNGRSYTHIIRNPDTGTLINLKPLDPSSMVDIYNKEGVLIRFEQITKNNNKTGVQTFQPEEILHLFNDRVADDLRGCPSAEAVQWVIDARNEAMNDWKRISHRSTIRVMYIDMDNIAKLTKVKTEYANAIEKGELMIIPAKKGEAEFEDLDLPPIDAFLRWIQYLEGFFYQAVRTPRVIATADGTTESGGKIGVLTFEPAYTWEQTVLEADMWNQLAIKIKFNRPPSLGGDLARDEAKDPKAFQPNDTQAGVGQ